MLREPTQSVWQVLADKPELKGFVLVGGSALALHLNHRISEDLDFAWPQPRLPREALRQLTEAASGLKFDSRQDPWADREANDCGLDLYDFSQNYFVNDQVKVTFFCPDAPERKILSETTADTVRIATIPEIFAMKALVSAKRSKTRDWFDLYVLMKDHGFTWRDIHEAFAQAGSEGYYDIAADRLSRARPAAKDEGYEALLPNPPSIEQMREFFLQRRNAYERGEESPTSDRNR
jgi:predicted nucleotidyltransferase component of viral defense system